MNNTLKDLDDVDDDLFISKKPQNYIFADKKAQDIQERTSKSLSNTISLVQESEKIGQSTLENLSSQRETLERVENDLDSINSMTRSTQKHLNNMRSFFGGIRSLFSNNNSANSSAQTIVPSTSGARIPKSATLAHVPSGGSVASSSSMTTAQIDATKFSNSTFRHPKMVDKFEPPKDEFEANLSEIGFGLGRLKEMAMKLGDEIEDQNEVLDRITDKSERAGDSIKHQNRQMQQLLKKG